MSLRRLWIFVSLLISACTSLPQPTLDPLDCVARLDCYLVNVDNTSGKDTYEIRINGAKYGEVLSYHSSQYSLYASRLINGNCAYVTARPINDVYKPILTSEQVCIYSNEHYQVNITNDQNYIWLVPVRN